MSYTFPRRYFPNRTLRGSDTNSELSLRNKVLYIDRDQYPIDCFPPEARDLIMNTHHQVGCSLGAIGSTLIGVCSLVCQGKIRIRKTANLVSPATLWLLTAQSSGERKTALLNILLKPIREYDQRQEAELEQKNRKYEIEMGIWKERRKFLMKMAVKELNADHPRGDLEAPAADIAVKDPAPPTDDSATTESELNDH